MPIKGMRDIKTHGTLSREGKLFSVARDLHRINRGKINSVDLGAWDGSVARNATAFDKNKLTKFRSSLNAIGLPFYQGEIMEKLVSFIEDDIREMKGFMAEGLPGTKEELERLRQRLSRVKMGRV